MFYVFDLTLAMIDIDRMSRAKLDTLRLENAVRGRFLYARQLWRAKQKGTYDITLH